MSVNSRAKPAAIVCTKSELTSNNKIDITFPYGEMAHNIGVYARIITQQETEEQPEKTRSQELVSGTDYEMKFAYDAEADVYGAVEIKSSYLSGLGDTLKSICVYRKINNYQNLDFDVYTNHQGLSGSAVDKLTLMAQDTQLSESYAIHAPYDDKTSTYDPKMELPAAGERKKKFVRFDNKGDVTVNEILAGKGIEVKDEPESGTPDAVKISLKVKDNNEDEDKNNKFLTVDADKNIAAITLEASDGIKVARDQDNATVGLNLQNATDMQTTNEFLMVAADKKIKTRKLKADNGVKIERDSITDETKVSLNLSSVSDMQIPDEFLMVSEPGKIKTGYLNADNGIKIEQELLTNNKNISLNLVNSTDMNNTNDFLMVAADKKIKTAHLEAGNGIKVEGGSGNNKKISLNLVENMSKYDFLVADGSNAIQPCKLIPGSGISIDYGPSTFPWLYKNEIKISANSNDPSWTDIILGLFTLASIADKLIGVEKFKTTVESTITAAIAGAIAGGITGGSVAAIIVSLMREKIKAGKGLLIPGSISNSEDDLVIQLSPSNNTIIADNSGVRGNYSGSGAISISENIISVSPATTEQAGVVKPDGTSITINNGVISATASGSNYQAGNGIQIDAENTIAAKLDGLTLAVGSAGLKGNYIGDGAVTVSENKISVPTATAATLGVVKPDNTSIKVNAGTVSVAQASNTVFGGVQYVSATAKITANGTWTSSPYTQTITVANVKSTDQPIADIVLSTTAATAKSQLEQWAKVERIETLAGQIKIYCYDEKPTMDLDIKLLIIRNT